MSDLMRVIAHGRGHVPGVTIIGDKIEAWPEDAGPKPTAEELERWTAELAESKEDYRLRRLEEYRRRGATETACIEAIIEYLAGHPQKMQQLAEIRDGVKRDIPKE